MFHVKHSGESLHNIIASGGGTVDLDQRVKNDIIALAKKNGIHKVILFGSRARDTNGPRSDIDLAVLGGDVLNFSFDVEEEAWTLLCFDVVDLAERHSPEFLAEIQRDGVILYESIP